MKNYGVLQADCFDHIADGSSVFILNGLFYNKDEVASAAVRKNTVHAVCANPLALNSGVSNHISTDEFSVPVLFFKKD